MPKKNIIGRSYHIPINQGPEFEMQHKIRKPPKNRASPLEKPIPPPPPEKKEDVNKTFV